jgi:hypothetical protein
MLQFIASYWDKLIVAVVAIYGAALSTYSFIHSKKKDARENISAAAELQRQIKSSDRGHKIAAKSALLASYNQYLSVIEERNNIFMSAGSNGPSHDTSYTRTEIDKLEKELAMLINETGG